MPLQKYEGEVVPFQKYDGEVLPLDQEIQSRGNAPAPREGGPILRDKEGKTAETQLETPSAEEQFRLNHPEIAGPADAITAPIKGVYNAGAETVGMGLDAADSVLGTEMGNAFRRSPLGPFVRTGRKDADFVQDTAQITTGALAGGKIVKNVLGKAGGMGTVARTARNTGIALGAEAGAVASMNKDTPRLFVNDEDNMFIPDVLEESWTPPIDPNAPDAEQRMKAAADLYQEAVISAAGLGMAGTFIRPVLGYGKTVWSNITNAANKDVLEQGFAKDLYEIGARITPDMTREERLQAIEDFIAAMKKNEDEIIQFKDTDLKDVNLNVDTVSKIISTLDPKNPDDLQRINILEGLRSAALQGRNSPQLEVTLNSPKRALDDTLEGLQQSRGGDEAIGKARDTIVEEALGNVLPLKNKVTSANADLVLARRGLDNEMASNPAFKDVMKRTKKDVNVFTTKPTTDIADQITTKVHDVDDALTARKNELYGKIGDGEVDQESVIMAAEKAGDAMTPELKLGLTDAGTRFQNLAEWSRGPLEDEIQANRRLGRFNKVDKLRELQRNIVEDQLDYIAKMNPQIAKDAAEAKKFFKEEYVPKFRQGPGQDLQGNRRNQSEMDARVENRKMIESTLSDNKAPEYSNQIIDILSTPTKNTAANPQLALDYGLSTLAGDFQREINRTGRVDAETMGRLAAQIDKFQPIIQRLAPQKQKEISDFLTSIRDKNFNVQEVQARLTEFQKDLAAKEDKWLGDYMDAFFRKGSDGYTALPDGYKSLKKVFFDSQKENQLRQIKLAAAKDPIATKGLEAAWGKALSEHIGKNTVTTSSIPDDLLKSGRVIFENQPELLDGLQQIIKKAQSSERANTLRQGGGLDSSASQEARSTSINQVITWVWGVLNPTAAKIRTVTRDVLKNRSAKPVAQQAIDTLLADKDTFVSIAQNSLRKEKGQLTLREKQALFRSMVKAGIYEPEDEQAVVGSGDINEQTEQALPKPK